MESRTLQMPKKRKFRFPWRAIVAVVLLFITLFPIYWLLAMSIRNNSEMAGSIPVIPQSFTMEHFIALFTEQDFGLALTNSLQVTAVSVTLSLAFGLVAAYVIARRRFRFGAGGWDAEASAYAPITPTASLARPSASYHTLGRRENDSTSP